MQTTNNMKKDFDSLSASSRFWWALALGVALSYVIYTAVILIASL